MTRQQRSDALRQQFAAYKQEEALRAQQQTFNTIVPTTKGAPGVISFSRSRKLGPIFGSLMEQSPSQAPRASRASQASRASRDKIHL